MTTSRTPLETPNQNQRSVFARPANCLAERCSKNGDLPKSPLLTIGSLVPSVGTKLLSRIDVGLDRRGRGLSILPIFHAVPEFIWGMSARNRWSKLICNLCLPSSRLTYLAEAPVKEHSSLNFCPASAGLFSRMLYRPVMSSPRRWSGLGHSVPMYSVPVPSFGLRLRCERCGYAGALRVDHGVSANRPHMLTG